jgi:hypothetical protein
MASTDTDRCGKNPATMYTSRRVPIISPFKPRHPISSDAQDECSAETRDGAP